MATTIGRIRVREAGAGGGGTGLLSSWLTADPGLEGLTVRREAAAGPPAGNAMGMGEDLATGLATGLAVAALEAAFLQLLRARRGDGDRGGGRRLHADAGVGAAVHPGRADRDGVVGGSRDRPRVTRR